MIDFHYIFFSSIDPWLAGDAENKNHTELIPFRVLRYLLIGLQTDVCSVEPAIKLLLL